MAHPSHYQNQGQGQGQSEEGQTVFSPFEWNEDGNMLDFPYLPPAAAHQPQPYPHPQPHQQQQHHYARPPTGGAHRHHSGYASSQDSHHPGHRPEHGVQWPAGGDGRQGSARAHYPAAINTNNRASSSRSYQQDESPSPLVGRFSPLMGKRGDSGSGGKQRGFSCHQCKSTKTRANLLFCSSQAERGFKRRCCRKKYCAGCLKRAYHQSIHISREEQVRYQCPSCCGLCTCASCQRKYREHGIPVPDANGVYTLPSVLYEKELRTSGSGQPAGDEEESDVDDGDETATHSTGTGRSPALLGPRVISDSTHGHAPTSGKVSRSRGGSQRNSPALAGMREKRPTYPQVNIAKPMPLKQQHVVQLMPYMQQPLERAMLSNQPPWLDQHQHHQHQYSGDLSSISMTPPTGPSTRDISLASSTASPHRLEYSTTMSTPSTHATYHSSNTISDDSLSAQVLKMDATPHQMRVKYEAHVQQQQQQQQHQQQQQYMLYQPHPHYQPYDQPRPSAYEASAQLPLVAGGEAGLGHLPLLRVKSEPTAVSPNVSPSQRRKSSFINALMSSQATGTPQHLYQLGAQMSDLTSPSFRVIGGGPAAAQLPLLSFGSRASSLLSSPAYQLMQQTPPHRLSAVTASAPLMPRTIDGLSPLDRSNLTPSPSLTETTTASLIQNWSQALP